MDWKKEYEKETGEEWTESMMSYIKWLESKLTEKTVESDKNKYYADELEAALAEKTEEGERQFRELEAKLKAIEDKKCEHKANPKCECGGDTYYDFAYSYYVCKECFCSV